MNDPKQLADRNDALVDADKAAEQELLVLEHPELPVAAETNTVTGEVVSAEEVQDRNVILDFDTENRCTFTFPVGTSEWLGTCRKEVQSVLSVVWGVPFVDTDEHIGDTRFVVSERRAPPGMGFVAQWKEARRVAIRVTLRKNGWMVVSNG